MKWIPCSERLPELDLDVLVCFAPPYSYYEVMQLSVIGQGDEGLWWFGADSPSDLDHVTHWMPLPEPPATENE